MATADPQALAERLFATFLAPLVVGGTMRPEKAIGGKGALSIGDGRAPADSDLLAKVELARVRVARKLAPIDTLTPAPTGTEWAIAAALHDVVQATHPGFNAALRRRGPAKILEVVDKTLEHVAPPSDVGDALSRHTWFSRMFDLGRTDIELKWWTGSQTFLGTEPPNRLLAWPEVRRVQQTRSNRPLMELPSYGASVDMNMYSATIQGILKKSPLTDLATLNRDAPAFSFTHENLTFAATQAGRTLALRAFALLPERAVDTALGRATRELFAQGARRALVVAVAVLRERALATALARLSKDEGPDPITLGPEHDNAAFAVSAGALAATQQILATGGGFEPGHQRALLTVLAPAANGAAANEMLGLLST